MRSDFEPKRIREAKETLGRQIESVQQMLQAQKAQIKEVEKTSTSLLTRFVEYMKKLF